MMMEYPLTLLTFLNCQLTTIRNLMGRLKKNRVIREMKKINKKRTIQKRLTCKINSRYIKTQKL